MNYIQEINALYDWIETNPLSGNAINLWHALMATSNKAGWINKFAVSISILEAKTGLNKKAIERARNELSQKGRIVWKSRSGNKSAEYSINSLCDKKSIQNVSQPVPQDGAQPVPQSVPQHVAINKLNETKLNETKKEDKSSISPVGDAPKVKPSFIIDEYNRICLNLRPVKLLTEKRSKMIMARVRQHGLENVIKMFELASKSSFLAGQSGNFSADLDWLIRPNNFVNVLEGKYNDKCKPINGSKPDKASPLEVLKQAYSHINQES